MNIGERVRYLVTGWMPEHDGAARFADARRGERPGLTDDAGRSAAIGVGIT